MTQSLTIRNTIKCLPESWETQVRLKDHLPNWSALIISHIRPVTLETCPSPSNRKTPSRRALSKRGTSWPCKCNRTKSKKSSTSNQTYHSQRDITEETPRTHRIWRPGATVRLGVEAWQLAPTTKSLLSSSTTEAANIKSKRTRRYMNNRSSKPGNSWRKRMII